MATALSVPLLMQHATAASAFSRVCAPNSDISSSGCGNTGVGNSGSGNKGNGNSGTGNTGNANSGSGNVGDGNSGCNNVGIANSGGSNVGVAQSGGTKCPPPKVKTPETTVPKTEVTEVTGVTEVPNAEPGAVEVAKTLPLTGSKTTGPLTLAVGFLLAGAAAIVVAGRRRMASATMHAKSTEGTVPLSESLGRLLSGRGPKSL
jgi:LPXTG-motif cell wall-anchored protein